MEIETVEIKNEFPDGYLLNEEESAEYESPEQVNQKPYKCGICGHRTTADTLLKVHMKMHFVKRLHQCHVCKESFNFVTELNAHILTHSKELNGFHCEHCGKDCFTEEDLHKHYRIHTKEKPYKCKLCLRCFSEEFYLRTHERSHHGEEYTKKTMMQNGTFVDPNVVKHLSDDTIRVSVGENKEVKTPDTKNKRQVHTYSEENLRKAITEIRGGAKIRETCRRYGVPRATVQDRITGRVADKPRRMGPDPVLSFENEGKIVRWIVNLANCGLPVRKQELISTVHKIVIRNKIKSPFKDGKPGETWYRHFLKRHPEISAKIATLNNKLKVVVSEQSIKKWFNELKIYLENVNAEDILKDPSRIINTHQADFNFSTKIGRVLFTYMADGRICPPVVDFPYIKPSHNMIQNIPKSTFDWMKADKFLEFLQTDFKDWLERENIKKPVLFLLDGHRLQMSLELYQFCNNQNIILYSLPSNATLIQPADVSISKPMKENWRQYVREWLPKKENRDVSKIEFSHIIEKILNHPTTSENIKIGFERCGLFPFNPDAVDYSKYVHMKLEDISNGMQIIPKITETNTSNELSEITRADITSTIKVLTIMKTTFEEKAIDINAILGHLETWDVNKKATQYETPQFNTFNSINENPHTDVSIENINNLLEIQIDSQVSTNILNIPNNTRNQEFFDIKSTNLDPTIMRNLLVQEQNQSESTCDISNNNIQNKRGNTKKRKNNPKSKGRKVKR